MNREIKFRAWNRKTNEMLLVNKIEYPKQKDIDENPDLTAEDLTFVFFTDGSFINLKWATLLQYIGLKDKNGKEIYEGDIVTLRRNSRHEDVIYTTGVVDFSSGCFWIRGDGYAEVQHWHFNDSDREIIGNIYENPELVKSKDEKKS